MGEDKKLEVCKVKHSHHDKLIWYLAGALTAITVYAMDWQRDQDKQMTSLKEINAAQTEIIKRQTKFNDLLQQSFMPVSYTSNPILPTETPPHLGTINNPMDE